MNKKSKILAFLGAGILLISLFVLIGYVTRGGEIKGTEETSGINDDAEFIMHYPSNLHSKYGKQLVLPSKPKRIVVLSNAALQIMQECNIEPVGVTSSIKYLPYEDRIKNLPKITIGMHQLDTESILALKPDLIIMGYFFEEKYGKLLAQAEVPIYYTSEGPIITYQETKEEAIALSKSFGGEAKEKEISERFRAVEKKMAAFAEKNKDTTLGVLFGLPPEYQQTSKGYLGSLLAQLGYKNLADEHQNAENRIVPLDVELLIKENPQVIVALGSMQGGGTAAEEAYAAEFAKAPEIWGQLQAIKNKKFFCLDQEYTTSKGVYVIKSIEKLISGLEKMNAGK